MEPAFSDLALSSDLLLVLAELGFDRPTPIQSTAIPPLLKGQDLVAQAQTGSGKTAAFALPILDRIDLPTRELKVLVLCPTRELSAQVARDFRKLGRRHAGLSVLTLAGGEPVRGQAAALAQGVHIVVGTPGRVLDHLRRRHLKVHRVATVVLDEADRMLDMGFLEDMEKILKALPKPHQTAFFSATFPNSIEALSRKHQQTPVMLLGPGAIEALPDIRQQVLYSEDRHKVEALLWALEHHGHDSALVFTNLKVTAAEVEKALAAAGVSVASLHGDLEQWDRDRVMAKFRNGSVRVLVATDVAARGIDVEALDLVINFELPAQPEIYVHRIGRTGRAGKVGAALALCAPREKVRVAAIEQFTGHALAPLARPARASASSVKPVQPLARAASMVTLRIAGGRKDKLRAGDIVGALTGEAGGLDAKNLGKIEIHDHFTYVAVSTDISVAALKNLNEGRIKGRKFKTVLEQ